MAEITENIKSGLGLALRKRQVDLQQEGLDFKIKQARSASNVNKINMSNKLAAIIKDARGMPKAVATKFMNAQFDFAENSLGVKWDRNIIDAATDKEMGPQMFQAATALETAMRMGDEESGAEASQALLDAHGIGQGVKTMMGIREAFDKAQVATKQFGRELVKEAGKQKFAAGQQEERISSAEGIAQRKQEFEIAKAKRKRIRELQTDVLAIDKEFNRQEGAIKGIKQIALTDPEFKNPQAGISLVRLKSALDEFNASVVRESEFLTIASAAGVTSRALSQLKSWKSGEKIPQEVANNIVAISLSLEQAIKNQKVSRLSGIVRSIKDEGFQDARKSILGANIGLFTKKKKNLRGQAVIKRENARRLKSNEPVLTKEQESKLMLKFGGNK